MQDLAGLIITYSIPILLVVWAIKDISKTIGVDRDILNKMDSDEEEESRFNRFVRKALQLQPCHYYAIRYVQKDWFPKH